MYKTIAMWLLGISAVFGQQMQADADLLPATTEKLLTLTDFKTADGRMIVDGLPCKLEVGTNTANVLVSVICQRPVFDQIGLDKINEMIRTAHQKVRNTIDPDLAYVPTEIRMAYNPALKDWSLTNLFTVRHKDGKENSSLLALDFDSTGKYLKMRRIY